MQWHGAGRRLARIRFDPPGDRIHGATGARGAAAYDENIEWILPRAMPQGCQLCGPRWHLSCWVENLRGSWGQAIRSTDR